MSNTVINPYNFVVGNVGAWKELARTTLGSSNDSILVSGLSNKMYYMVLCDLIQVTSNVRSSTRLNADSATNYSNRDSENGAADSTATSQTYMKNSGSITYPCFNVQYISNLLAQEKLSITSNVGEHNSGASSAPTRMESVGKWANTSSVITSIEQYNDQPGSFDTGSEVVVLGYDPTDTHTTADNFWQELASVELGAPSATLDSGTFTAKKYLWIQAYINAVTVDTGLTFNGDTGTNYARRWSDNGAADGTAVSGTNIQVDRGNSTQFLNIFIVNVSANEKLGMYNTVTQNTAGASNVPDRRELVFKWDNTSSQITSMIFTKKGGGTDLQAGSIVKVWGSD